MQTVQRLSDKQNVRIWAVFANRSLQSLIADSIASAWESHTSGGSFLPLDRVELHHIKDILQILLPEVGLDSAAFPFNYDEAAEAYLQRKNWPMSLHDVNALFIDEAQDLGPMR